MYHTLPCLSSSAGSVDTYICGLRVRVLVRAGSGARRNFETFAAWLFESWEQNLAWLFLHGNVKKTEGCLYFFFVFSFWRRNFTIFRAFSAILTLTDGRFFFTSRHFFVLPWRTTVPNFVSQFSKTMAQKWVFRQNKFHTMRREMSKFGHK